MTSMIPRNALGRTGLTVSSLGFGAAPLGDVYGVLDPEDGAAAVHAAIDGGINFFDVAPYYGHTLAETRLGEALSGRRHEVVLATKCGRQTLDRFDFTRDGILASVDGSLARLRTDVLDLLSLHDVEFVDHRQVLDVALPALREIKQQGIARAIGITGLPIRHLARLAQESDVDGVLSYCHGNLLVNDLASAFAPLVAARGLFVLNASPLHMGLLTAKAPPPWHPAPKEIIALAQRLALVCVDNGWSLPDLALRFASEVPCASTVLGLKSVEEVNHAVRAVKTPLPDAARRLLTEMTSAHLNVTWIQGRPEYAD